MIIAICLNDTDSYAKVSDIGLQLDQFAIAGHKFIFMAMNYLYKKGQTPTGISIMEVITSEKGKKAVEELGGLTYIADLEHCLVQPDNLEIFCNKVICASIRRSILGICENTTQFMLSEDSEILNEQELVSKLEQQLAVLKMNAIVKSNVYKMGSELHEVLLKRTENPAEIPGLEVGIPVYDQATHGAQGGDFIVICARSKCGKSVLLNNFATNLAIKQQIPIAYIDTEMTAREQEDRLLANLSNVPHHEIMSGMFCLDTSYGTAEDKMARLSNAQAQILGGAFYHEYMPQFTPEKLRATVLRMIDQHDIKAVFFDYLKMTSNTAGSLRTAQEYQLLGYIATTLKELSGELQIPIFTCVQENRNDTRGTDKGAENVGGSDRILHNATKLMFLYNKTPEEIALNGGTSNKALKIAFQRNGGSDLPPLNINFEGDYLRMNFID